MPDALILVAHGSPDPDWRRPLEALEARLKVLAPDRGVKVAYMDFLSPSLADAARELAATGHARALVVAAFLSPGGRHIKRDIVELVAKTKTEVPDIELRLAPGALGDDAGVIEALAAATLRRATE